MVTFSLPITLPTVNPQDKALRNQKTCIHFGYQGSLRCGVHFEPTLIGHFIYSDITFHRKTWDLGLEKDALVEE